METLGEKFDYWRNQSLEGKKPTLAEINQAIQEERDRLFKEWDDMDHSHKYAKFSGVLQALLTWEFNSRLSANINLLNTVKNQ